MPKRQKSEIKENKKNVCGLIMPISSLDGCTENHWQDVKEILNEAIEQAGFESHLVSDADEAGIIQKRIIQNLYENPIVVCDVSGKNPNVMFELGIRLAFDKPTIIIKDDKTSYSFDTAPIEHLEYPRDLRFAHIVTFKEQLSEKIKATYKKSTSDTNYTTFLKNFGTFTTPKIETEEIPQDRFILEELQQLRKEISQQSASRYLPQIRRKICALDCTPKIGEKVLVQIKKIPNIGEVSLQKISRDHYHFIFSETVSLSVRDFALETIKKIISSARLV